MYHKSHGYRVRGGSIHSGPVPDLVWKSQHDVPSLGATYLESDTAVPPLPTTSISSLLREEHDGALDVDTCNDSAKKVLKVAPLISLEEAQRREVSRRNRTADRVLEKEVRIEREVNRLKREVAEIARKKAQAKLEQESNSARLGKEDQEKKTQEGVETREREEGSMLTAAVATREDGLVVAPTNWIVPLISLDEAQHVEKAKRDGANTKPPLLLSSPPPSVLAPVNSIAVNAGDGNTATLQLISLAEARGRDRMRRVEEEAVSRRAQMPGAQAGTGLSHVSLITLVEARKQDALRRNTNSHGRGKPLKAFGSMSRSSRKPSPPSPSPSVNRVIERGGSDLRALTNNDFLAQENARWIHGWTCDTENWWTRPNAIPAYRPAYTNGHP